MRSYLICALLMYLQQSAVCWRVTVVSPSRQKDDACENIISDWLAQSEAFYARAGNRELLQMPQISCSLIEHEPVRLPEGARWVELGEMKGLIIQKRKAQ